jgi:MFS family permease
MLLAVVPGLFAAAAIVVAAREARRTVAAGGGGGGRRRLDLAGLRRAGLGRALLPIVPFELGNVATTLLILPATQLLTGGGRSVQAAASLAILIYAGHNVLAAAASVLGGRWVDRSGPRIVFAGAAALYVAGYAGFAAGWRSPVLLAAFALAGLGIGLAETAESALVARLLPDRLRGSGFGVLGGVQSAGDLLASAVVGILYAAVSPAAGFGYAAGWMVLSVTASAATRPAAAAR